MSVNSDECHWLTKTKIAAIIFLQLLILKNTALQIYNEITCKRFHSEHILKV